MSSGLPPSCEGSNGSQNNDGEVSTKFVPINYILCLLNTISRLYKHDRMCASTKKSRKIYNFMLKFVFPARIS